MPSQRMSGGARGVARTGDVHHTPNLSAAGKQKGFEGNAMKVHPRLEAQIKKQAWGCEARGAKGGPSEFYVD